MPIETRLPSEKPVFGSWHVAHEIVRSSDRAGSKNRSRPSAMVSAVGGLSSGNGMGGRPSGDLISTTAPIRRAGLLVSPQELESTSVIATAQPATQGKNRDIIERL